VLTVQTPDTLENYKLYVSAAGLFLSLIGGVLALQSFYRNEKWKKAEFLAKEMKDFFENANVQKALLLIDWGIRRIKLLPSGQDDGYVVVTRPLQVSALRPHIFLRMNDSNSEMISSTECDYRETFTPSEACIRDCYDSFLDGLERLSSYVRTGVVGIKALRPYIGYWVDDIHAPTTSSVDAAWMASLLTYISFYKLEGVLWLFSAFERDIGPKSDAYIRSFRTMEDQEFASKLAKCVGTNYP